MTFNNSFSKKNYDYDDIEFEKIYVNYFLYEYFINNKPNNVKQKKNYSNKTYNNFYKYNNTVKLNTVNTILIDNNDIILNLFTNKEGYILNHFHANNLNKFFIIESFLKSIKEYLKLKFSTNYIFIKSNNQKILNDFDKILNLFEQYIPIEKIFNNDEFKYLYECYNIYFILIVYNDNKRVFKNIIELYKIIKDSNHALNNIKLIQNLIFIERHDNNNKNIIFDLNKESIQPLIISYFNNNKKKFIKLYLGNNFPLTINFNIFNIEKSLSDLNNNKIDVDKNININNLNYSRNDSNNLIFQKSKSSKSLSHFSKNNIKNDITNISNDELNNNVFNEEILKYYINKNFITLLVNKNFLYDYFNEKIFSFISFIEKNAKIKIKFCLFNFIKDFLNQRYFFIGGYNLIAIKVENENKLFQCESARLLNKNNNYIENKKKFKCYGEFCNYIIPNNIKDLEFKIKTNDYLLKNLLNNNYLKNYSIPIFILKKVNDNPQIVNLILKCYNIFPKNINKEKMFNDIIKEKEKILNNKNFLSKNINKIKSLNIPLFSDLDEIKNNFDNEQNENEIILYKPKKLFENQNIQKIYNNLPICYNCYNIYRLIEKYIKELEKKLFHNKNLFENNRNNSFEKKMNKVIKQSENYQINSYDNIKIKNNLLLYEKLKEKNFLSNLVENLNKKKNTFLDNNRKCFSHKKFSKYNNQIKLFNRNKLNYSVFNNSLNNSKLFKIKIKENQNKNKFLNVTFNKQKYSNINKKYNNSSLEYRRMYLGYPAKINSNNNIFNKNLNKVINIMNKNLNNQNQNNNYISNNRNKFHHNIDIDIFFNLRELKNSNLQTFSEMTENRIFNFIKSRTDEELIEKNNFMKKIFNEDIKNNVNKNIPKTSQIGLKKNVEEESILSSIDFKLEEEEEIKDNINNKINKINYNNNINDFNSNKNKLLLKKHEELLKKINKKNSNEKSNIINKNNDSKLHDITEINDSEESIFNNQIKQNKKYNVQLFSIYHKKNYKESNEFYYVTSPLIKMKDGIPIYKKNPLIKYNNLITSKDYSIIANFPYSNFLMNSEIYINNNYTAIPYKILTYHNKENIDTKNKLVLFIINDVYDTYEKYYNFFKKLFDKSYKNNKLKNFIFLKIIFFNLPGQAYTLWAHKDILNNIYYANFIDKFIFYLYNIKKIFDINTHISFFGFGFGGHIILTYINLYKNFNINFNLILLFNSYLYVDNFLKKSLNQIKQYIIKKKDIYFIKNFIKFLYNNNIEDKNVNDDEIDKNNIDNIDVLEEEELKLNGLLSIINGINYNIDINNKLNINNIKTPIIFLNSLDNNFIKFKNIENILLGIEENRSNILIENFNKNKNFNFSELYIDYNNDINDINNYYKIKNNNKNFSNIKIIIIKGPHELIDNNNKEYVVNLINSYIYTYNILNN